MRIKHEVSIEQVSVDQSNHLRIKPILVLIDGYPLGYNHIYRAAMSVRWDRPSGELYVLDVPHFTIVDEFRQIVNAVSQEYSHHLQITPTTTFVGLSAEHVTELKSVDFK